jgi:hypothetical protein
MTPEEIDGDHGFFEVFCRMTVSVDIAPVGLSIRGDARYKR